jgi:hypothetical protein
MKAGKDKFKHFDPRTLKRYLEGRGNKNEQQLIANWFSDLWTNEQLRKISHELWDNIPKDIAVTCYDEERIHDRIHHILILEEAAAHDKEKSKTKLNGFLQHITAVLIIPLVLFTLFNWKVKLGENQNTTNTVIYSQLGTRTGFTLPDGSTGWLNGENRLEDYTYRATFIDEKPDEVWTIFQHTSPIVYKELGRESHSDGTCGKRTSELYCQPKIT